MHKFNIFYGFITIDCITEKLLLENYIKNDYFVYNQRRFQRFDHFDEIQRDQKSNFDETARFVVKMPAQLGIDVSYVKQTVPRIPV